MSNKWHTQKEYTVAYSNTHLLNSCRDNQYAGHKNSFTVPQFMYSIKRLHLLHWVNRAELSYRFIQCNYDQDVMPWYKTQLWCMLKNIKHDSQSLYTWIYKLIIVKQNACTSKNPASTDAITACSTCQFHSAFFLIRKQNISLVGAMPLEVKSTLSSTDVKITLRFASWCCRHLYEASWAPFILKPVANTHFCVSIALNSL